jgi:hypothetical protein
MATDNQQNPNTKTADGSITTREAGEMGGQRVSELVEKGKQHEQEHEPGRDSASQGFGERAGQPDRQHDTTGGNH